MYKTLLSSPILKKKYLLRPLSGVASRPSICRSSAKERDITIVFQFGTRKITIEDANDFFNTNRTKTLTDHVNEFTKRILIKEMKQLTTKKSKQKSLTDEEKYTKINILLNQK